MSGDGVGRRSDQTFPLLVILPCFQPVYIEPAPADWRTYFSRYLQYSAPGWAEPSCHHQPHPRSLWRSSCHGVGLGLSTRRSSAGSSWWAGRGGPAGRRTSGPCAPPTDGGDQYRPGQPVGCWGTCRSIVWWLYSFSEGMNEWSGFSFLLPKGNLSSFIEQLKILLALYLQRVIFWFYFVPNYKRHFRLIENTHGLHLYLIMVSRL